MAAIDLLFETKGESERLHQLVLGPLLTRTHLLSRLLGREDMQPADYVWEPNGGRFDLAIKMTDGDRRVWVELKVDAALSDHQVQQQLDLVAQHPGDLCLYLLLGFSDIVVRREHLHQVAPDRHAIRGIEDVLPHLGDPAILPPPSDRHHADARDLVAAYRDLLLRLQQRTAGFFANTGAWSLGDYFGFFDHCRRQAVGSMATADVGYVANPNGGFAGCWWKWTEIEHGVKLYLQLEDKRLCFKIEVPKELEARAGQLRDKALDVVLAVAKEHGVPAARPQRLGHGTWMTVAVLEDPGVGAPARWDHFTAAIVTAEQVLETAVARIRATRSTDEKAS